MNDEPGNRRAEVLKMLRGCPCAVTASRVKSKKSGRVSLGSHPLRQVCGRRDRESGCTGDPHRSPFITPSPFAGRGNGSRIPLEKEARPGRGGRAREPTSRPRQGCRAVFFQLVDDSRAQVFGSARVYRGRAPKHQGAGEQKPGGGRGKTAKPQARPRVSLSRIFAAVQPEELRAASP